VKEIIGGKTDIWEDKTKVIWTGKKPGTKKGLKGGGSSQKTKHQKCLHKVKTEEQQKEEGKE